MDIIGRFLPEKARALLKDKEVARDLGILLEEVEKEIGAASKNPATKGKLKDAFNSAATVVSAARTYVKDGKLSMMQTARLTASALSIHENVQTLGAAYKEKDPVVIGTAQSLKDNQKVFNAVKNLLLKTNGNLFRLELGADGQGYAVELMSGNNMRFPVPKQDFDEIQAILKTQQEAKKEPPKNEPPKPAV